MEPGLKSHRLGTLSVTRPKGDFGKSVLKKRMEIGLPFYLYRESTNNYAGAGPHQKVVLDPKKGEAQKGFFTLIKICQPKARGTNEGQRNPFVVVDILVVCRECPETIRI